MYIPKPVLTTLLLLVASLLGAQPTINQLVGANVDAKDPIERVMRFSFVRPYHDFAKDTGYPGTAGVISCPPEFELQWNPSNDGGGYYFFDDFYQQMANRNSSSLKGTHPSMAGYNHYPDNYAQALELKPICTPTLNGLNVPLDTIPGPAYLDAINNFSDATDPANFVAVSKWLTLYAARYGNTTYPINSSYVQQFIAANLSADESLVTGLGYTNYMEPNNEPDKTWYDAPADVEAQADNPTTAITYWYFAPEQYAAMVSATYDGHGDSPAFKIEEITNETHHYGIHNADPNMKYVLAGLAEMRGQYVERMVAWFETYRQPGQYGFVQGPVIPFDVINFHHYSTEASAEKNTYAKYMNEVYFDVVTTFSNPGGDAVSPEDDLLREKIGWFMSLLNQGSAAAHVVGKEIWYSEFGYDTENSPDSVENSDVNIPNYGDPCRAGQEIQGQWLVRAILEMSAAEGDPDGTPNNGDEIYLDRAFVFNHTNDQTLGVVTYSSSGLLDDNESPKKGWYYLMTLKHVLGSHSLAADMSNGVTITNSTNSTGIGPRIYQYSGGGNVYAIWSPTSSDAAYTMDVTFNNAFGNSAHYIKLKDLSEIGEKVDVSGQVVGNTIVGLPVNESPIFLKLGISYSNPLGVSTMDPAYFDVESLCCNGVRLSYRSINSNGQFLSTRNMVYYARKSEMQAALMDGDPSDDWNAFDLSLTIETTNSGGGPEITQVIKLHSENAGLTSTVINGLEAGEEYWFWVIPVDMNGELTANIDPCDPNNDLDKLWTDGTVGGCPIQDCIIDIDPIWVTTSYPSGSTNEAKVIATLTDSDPPLNCGWLAMDTIIPANTYHQYGPNAENWFVIEFPHPYEINAVYWNDGQGIGIMEVEYQICNCEYWQPWTSLYTIDYHKWKVWNPIDPTIRRKVKKLRFTKVNDEANIPKLLFCGEQKACSGTIPPKPQPFTYDPPKELNVIGLAPDQASLEWLPAIEKDSATASVGNVITEYVVYYEEAAVFDSIDLDNNKQVSTNYLGAALLNLKPGTTYKAVAKVKKPKPCVIDVSLRSNIVVFTTPSENQNARLGRPDETSSGRDAVKLHIQPNPAKDQVRIAFPDTPFGRIEIVSRDGQLMYAKAIAEGEQEITVHRLSQWPAGLYFVKGLSAKAGVVSRKLVVVR